jgi:hypothetical protein
MYVIIATGLLFFIASSTLGPISFSISL